MPLSYSNSEIPSFARDEAYDFESIRKNYRVFQELNQIAEEIEKCRLRNI